MGDESSRDFAGYTKTIFSVIGVNVVIYIVFSLLLFLIVGMVSASSTGKQNFMVAQSESELNVEVKLAIHRAKYKEKSITKSLPFHRSTLLRLHGISATSHVLPVKTIRYSND
ncbi:MAG: hypothetical protein GXP21_07935 [Gammaproteobacteria bacterium]|nr:hypothetical protein [Gammaproteobacteria bacterium]